ncbi:MAG: iron-siderophore ABC transporter substrate-binding protein [Pseudonocardiales bacterium]|nr:iron-siderophore ABC transporter substrate-binding protein [Pseudonocardiales bacterium]
MIDRRSFFRGAGLLGAGLALAACGGAPAPAGPAAGARTLAHKYGTTAVEGDPQRVVTVGLTEQDYAIALGAVPVGAREWFGGQPGALWPWAAEAAGGATPEVLPVDALNFEQIAALRPDLILGINSGLTQEEYDTLSGIAPTVAQPAGFADYGAPWQTITQTVGAALGREAEAAALVPAIEERFARARADNPGFAGRTGLLAALLEDGTFYVYAEGPAPRFLVDLGLTLPPAAEAVFTGPDRAPVALSLEQLPVLEADVLVIGLYGQAAIDARVDDPLFAGLTSVREGRAVLLPELSTANGAMTFGSVLSLPAALDEMVPRIAAALDGDPATAVSPAA